MSILPKPRHTHVDAISDKDIARALIDNQGLQYLAAEQLNIAATWLSVRIKQSEYLQAVRQACIELRIDKAEKVLCDMVESKNFNAVALTLRTLGRSRGYVETGVAVNPAESIKAFNETMALWGQKQMEALEEVQIDLKSDETNINSDI
jgi:hypothetical protein